MAAKIHLVTHGETALDREGRMHGWKVDAPLSLQGKFTAKKAAQKLKGKGIETIYCSPLLRCSETAEIIGREIGAKVSRTRELMPWNIANMGGAKTASIKPLLDFFSTRPHRVIPGGESKAQFLDRYGRFLKGLKGTVAIAGHSQHSLGLSHVLKGGDARKVPVVGGTPGEIRSVTL